MELQSKTIEFRNEVFEVRELTVGALLPMLKMMEDNPQEATAAITRASVHVGGKPIGKDLDGYPAALFMKLVNVVTEINQLGGDEGND